MDIRPVGNFVSVVDAVRCAVKVQREMAGRNTDVPSDRRIEFRMGIGEVRARCHRYRQ
jgi:adenylate cyclase